MSKLNRESIDKLDESEGTPMNGAHPVSTPSRNEASSDMSMSEQEVVKNGANYVFAPFDLAQETKSEPPSGLDEMSLDALAKKIKAGVAKIDRELSTARKYAEEALRAAIETGHYLIAAQEKCEREKTKWGAWRRENCPSLSQATAYRYMDLARKFSHVRSGKTIKTLRQAYLAVGLVDKGSPDGKSAADQTKAVTPGRLLSGLTKSRTLLQNFRKMPATRMRDMKPKILKQVADEVARLVEVCDEVKKKLETATEESARKLKITKAAKMTQAKKAKSKA